MRIIDILEFLRKKNYEFSFSGNKEQVVSWFSSLQNYKEDTITWVGRENAIPEYPPTNVALAVIQEGITFHSRNKIVSKESKIVFFSIIEELFDPREEMVVRGQNTYISPRVHLGKNVKIGHNCTLDGDIFIDEDTIIYNNVNIVNRCKIGKRCVIQSGVSIGHDGYGFSQDKDGKKTMLAHHGGVQIEDDVYISANTVIQRGTIDDTVIERGTKIDTLCHIAHNVHLGENTALVTLTGMYGSSSTGRNCYVASGLVKDNTHLGNNVQVGMNGSVMKNVEDDSIVIGTPAILLRKESRIKG